MTYTADSPATRRAVRTYWSTPGVQRDPAEALAAVLTEHKRGLQDRLAATQAVNARNGKVIDDLIAEREALVGELDSLIAQLAAAQSAPAAVVLPEVGPDTVAPADVRVGDRLRVVTEYQMTVSGVGNGRTSDGCVLHDDDQALTLDTSWPLDDVRTSIYLLDRPVDPDAAAVEAMARALAAQEGGNWEAWTGDARAALAAYRQHVDKEA